MMAPSTQPTVPFGSRTFAQPWDQPMIWYEPPTGMPAITLYLVEGPLRTLTATDAVRPRPDVVRPVVDPVRDVVPELPPRIYAPLTQPTCPFGRRTLYQPLL